MKLFKSIKSNQLWRSYLQGYLFILPFLLGLIFLFVGPTLFSFVISLTNWKIINKPSFIGFENYITMLTKDPVYKAAFINTLRYVIFSVSLSLILALCLAMLLNSKLRGVYFFRTLFYVPSVISGVVMATVWAWMMNVDFGIVNYFLSLIGIQGPNWLGDPKYAPWTLILMSLFNIGSPMIIFIAGLQNIPKYLYESASIDGANRIVKFFKITLPFLSPTILFNAITMTINAFRTFTQVYILTDGKGGPMNSTMLYSLYLYKRAFQYTDMGYASAMAWVLFLIIMLFTIILIKTSSIWVD